MIRKAKDRLLNRLSSLKAEPRQIAAGYAMGFLIGTTPLIGLKIWIALALSTFLRWSRPAAAIGVYHINAFTGPFFHALAFFVGRFVIGANKEFVFPENATPRALFEAFYGNGHIFLALTVGGLVIGIPVSIFLYTATFRIVKGLRGKNPS